MEEIRMKIKIWCEKYFRNSFILGNTNRDGVTIYNEKIIDFDLKKFENDLGHDGYYYANELYDHIHKNYNYVDIISNGDDLEFQIIEEGYLDDIPYLQEPLKSIDELKEKMKIKIGE